MHAPKILFAPLKPRRNPRPNGVIGNVWSEYARLVNTWARRNADHTHKAIAHFALPAGADVVKFDASTGRVYAACSSGFISVFQVHDANHFEKIEDFPVQKLVHSLAVDPATHRVYAPEQEEEGKSVARIVIYEPVERKPPKQ